MSSVLRPVTDALRALRRRLAMRALIVEDDPVVAGFVAHRLREVDDAAKVRVAGSADVALELLDRHLAPGLILLDWCLPYGMSAAAFLAALELRPSQPPVILLTGAPDLARSVVGDRYPIIDKAELGPGGGFLASVDALLAREDCDEETCRAATASRQRIADVEQRARERLARLER